MKSCTFKLEVLTLKFVKTKLKFQIVDSKPETYIPIAWEILTIANMQCLNLNTHFYKNEEKNKSNWSFFYSFFRKSLG